MRQEELRTKEKLFRSITSIDGVFALYPKAISERPTERIKRGIRSRLIYTSKKGPVLKGTDRDQLRESKYISAKKLNIAFEMLVFDDRVVLGSVPNHEMGTIMIQNKNIAESFKNLFDFIWESIPDSSA